MNMLYAPATGSDLWRLRARLEARERRMWWRLIQALEVDDLACVVGQALDEHAMGSTPPWHRSATRAAMTELAARFRV